MDVHCCLACIALLCVQGARVGSKDDVLRQPSTSSRPTARNGHQLAPAEAFIHSFSFGRLIHRNQPNPFIHQDRLGSQATLHHLSGSIVKGASERVGAAAAAATTRERRHQQHPTHQHWMPRPPQQQQQDAPDDAVTDKKQKQQQQPQPQQVDEEEGKERAPSPVPAATVEPTEQPPQQPPQAPASASSASSVSMVDDLISRGIKPATIRAITLYVDRSTG